MRIILQGVRLEPNMLKILPIIPSSTYFLPISTYYSILADHSPYIAIATTDKHS